MAAATISVELVEATRSHWLELNTTHEREQEPFSKEEVHPIVEVSGVPRVGTVRAELSADRYVYSSRDEATGSSSPKMGDWRIVLRDVRTPPGEGETRGKPAAGIGPATHAAIREACEPAIRAWLESAEYTVSRRRAAAWTARRAIVDAGVTGYKIENAVKTLERIRDELAPDEYAALRRALGLAGGAAEILDRQPVTG